MRTQSELILNPDGSIYHLALRPEHLATTIILVGDQDRVPKVSKYFDSIEFQQQKREFVCHTGRLGTQRLSVISTGIGTDNIDIVLQEIDALFNLNLSTGEVEPDLQQLKFVRIGTAGTMRADIPLDATVLSTHAIGMDNLLNYYPTPVNGALTTAIRRFLHEKLALQLPLQAVNGSTLTNEPLPFPVHRGITVTCPGFYGPQGRQLRIPLQFPNWISALQSFEHEGLRCANFEMETSGIYGLSKLLGHEAFSFSAILANRATGQFSPQPKVTVDHLIQEVLAWIVQTN